jgi:hydroxyacylglutathione hydrolase
MTNYALQIKGREEFIRQMTANLPARPEYFAQDAQINRQGAGALEDLPELAPVSAAELHRLIEQEVFALDVRPVSDFAGAHVPGSINIALSGQFASWAASVLGLKASPVLIADTPQQYEEARVRLARVGIEDLRGYLEGGVAAWQQAGLPLEELPQIKARELAESVREGTLRVLDVRRESEWQAGHIHGADWWPLDRFKVAPPELAPDVPLAVHCASGYRSVIACSLLRRAGMKNVLNVIGGFAEWQKAGLEVEKAEAAAVS